MREQVDRLQKLTTDLLDLSRLDAGSIELELEPVPLRTLADQVAGEFAAAAARKDAAIEWSTATRSRRRGGLRSGARGADRARADRQRARAHPGRAPASRSPPAPPPGGRAPRRGPADASPTTAPASAAGTLAHVFDRFHTGDSAQGSGLGLAIARELAQRMRGGLEVTSKPGQHRLHAHAAARGERQRPARTVPAATSASGCGGGRMSSDRCSRCLAALALAAGLVAGCGGDEGGDEPASHGRAHARRGGRGPRRRNGFNPAAIYERLSPGVVTVTSLFSEGDSLERHPGEAAAPARAAASCSTSDGYIATNAHVDHQRDGQAASSKARRGVRPVRGRQPGARGDRRLRPQLRRRAW